MTPPLLDVRHVNGVPVLDTPAPQAPLDRVLAEMRVLKELIAALQAVAAKPPPTNFTVPEVAEMLRCSVRHVWRLIASHKLKVLRAGRRKTLITGRELQRFIDCKER